MTRRLIAGVIVMGLAIGVWLLWPREGSTTTSTTLPVAVLTSLAHSTTSGPTTSVAIATTALDSHVVVTVEQAEAILRELWFGWFEGIYNQDEDRIREVVASQQMLDAARAQFGTLGMKEAPRAEALSFEDTALLRADSNCLAVWSKVSAEFRPGYSEGVLVLRKANDLWLMLGYWALKNDLWSVDCDSQLESLS